MPIGNDYKILDEAFHRLILPGARLERLYTGCLWAEGPVYIRNGDFLVWSDIPNNRMLSWRPAAGVSIFRSEANFSNGNTCDRQGRLLTCEHGGRRITRTETDGSIAVLVDRYQGKRLNSPNDLVVAADGSIWFTDPTYGILGDHEGYRGESEIGSCNVYRWDADTGETSVVADDFLMPNGIAFSVAEKFLYLADSGGSHQENGPHHIRVFDVVNRRTLVNGRIFAEISPGLADGFRVDELDHVWTSAGDGVHCYSQQGKLLGKILVPETVSNLTFGGQNNNCLFITATTSVYTIPVAVAGA